jgi:hypothetical protein
MKDITPEEVFAEVRNALLPDLPRAGRPGG